MDILLPDRESGDVAGGARADQPERPAATGDLAEVDARAL